MKRESKIWTDNEELIVDLDDIGELESAMRFKAQNIKAKAESELFEAVADALDTLWQFAVK